MSQSAPAADRLSGRLVRLEPLRPGHYSFAYSLLTSASSAPRWRSRGAIPSYQSFLNELTTQTLVAFLVIERGGDVPIGIVLAYDANMRDGYARLGVALDAQSTGTGAGVEATALLISYLFSHWSFRKLYGDSPEYNFSAVGTGSGTYFHEEARLQKHDYFNGQYWDLIVWAIYRDDWRDLERAIQSRPARSDESVPQ